MFVGGRGRDEGLVESDLPDEFLKSSIAPEQPKRNIPKIRKKLYWNTNSDK